MRLQTLTNRNKERGFTIVELLIVIVVIAILAAISIVAYTGIQDRARNSAGEQLASQVAGKIRAYHAINGNWPNGIENPGTTNAQLAPPLPDSEVNLEGANVAQGAVTTRSDAFNAGTQVHVVFNTSPNNIQVIHRNGSSGTKPITINTGS